MGSSGACVRVVRCELMSMRVCTSTCASTFPWVMPTHTDTHTPLRCSTKLQVHIMCST